MDIQKRSSPYKAIISLTWPQFLMMFFHFWIGFLDVYVAGLLNSKVQASLGIVTQILFFLLIVAISFANGAVSTISQSIGAGREKRAKRFAALCVGIGLVSGITLCLLGLFFRNRLVFILGTPKELYKITSYFLKIYVILIPVYYQFIVTNAIFRARKKVYVPLVSITIVTILNGILDFCFCFGYWIFPEMGFKGLPWATFFSVSMGCLTNFIILSKDRWLSFKYVPSLKWIRTFFPYLWTVSWPIGLNQLLWHLAYVVLFSITATLPNKNIIALAAFTAGVRIESILFLPAFAFNMTASILVGDFLGQGDFKCAKDVATKTWFMGVGVISIMGILVYFFLDQISEILSHEFWVQKEIINYLRYNIIAIPFTTTSMILGGTFVGAGATKFNMLSIGGSVWLFRVPLAYLLGHLILKEPTGIWVSMLISQVIQSIIMSLLFFSDKWKKYSMKKEVFGC